MDENEVLQYFKKETADHRMKIENDNEIFRHINFSRGGSSIYHFTLTTWPGHLCIGGDCGTYVFSRIYDMFNFFRMHWRNSQRSDGELVINPGYWAEKLQGGGGDHKALYTEWSPEDFEQRVQDIYDDWLENYDVKAYADAEYLEEARKIVAEEIATLKRNSNSEWEAASAIDGFSSEHISIYPYDFWETSSCRRLQSGFIWCLYAIVWGIRQYDMLKLAESSINKALPILDCAKVQDVCHG